MFAVIVAVMCDQCCWNLSRANALTSLGHYCEKTVSDWLPRCRHALATATWSYALRSDLGMCSGLTRFQEQLLYGSFQTFGTVLTSKVRGMTPCVVEAK
eukprot:4904555-Amphidinium_carterae.1